MNRKWWFVGLVVLSAVILCCWWATREGKDSSGESSGSSARTIQEVTPAQVKRTVLGNGQSETSQTPMSRKDEIASSADEAENQVPEELSAEEVEEKKVEAFDALTDQWMEPAPKGVSMKDVEKFTSALREVPDNRREECLQRALNLVPDDNVMLLAGVLMDKTFGNESIELVFNDILNRDEEVKKPILQQIFADRTHPCWATVAWILDVTGQLPAAKGGSNEGPSASLPKNP